jgi:UDP-glucuronate decarboxylase
MLMTYLGRLMNAKPDIAGPVNLGNPHEITIMELARVVLSLTGSRSRIEFLPLPEDDRCRRRPPTSTICSRKRQRCCSGGRSES